MTRRSRLRPRLSLQLLVAAALLGALGTGCAASRAVPGVPAAQDAQDAQADATLDTDKGVGHALLLYLPNRVFDLLDIARARLRAGPGFGGGVRFTRIAQADFGAWDSLFVGLSGPRPGPVIPWPFGRDRYGGADLTLSAPSPDDNFYGSTEIGLGVQLGIVGVDLGVDPGEAVDFVTGLVFVDLEGDDF